MGDNLKELADCVAAGKCRTVEDAVQAIAKKRGKSLAEFLVETCDEIGKNGGRWLMRRVAAAVEDEIAMRLDIGSIDIPGGTVSHAVFKLPVVLGAAERIWLGLLKKHCPAFLAGELSAMFSQSLYEACARCSNIGREGAARAVEAVKWRSIDGEKPRSSGGLVVAAPGVLAMPDAATPEGFRLLADAQAAENGGKRRKR